MTDAVHHDPPDRRDFLYVAAAALAGVGAAATAWPFIDQMEPSTQALAAGQPIDVDLTSVQPGQQIIVRWRSRPIFIVNRTPPMLAALKEPQLLSALRDPQSQEHQQPEYAANWSRSLKPEYLVLVGVCTHLGCIPTFSSETGSLLPGEPGGWLCHCHGSKYDLAGRVFQGVPAPYNLPVPPYHFVADKTVRIGENPKGSTFELASVSQI